MNPPIFVAARWALNFVTVGFALTISLVCAAATNDFEAYRLQQMQGAQEVKKEFQDYKEKQDREFASFLKGQWRDFATTPGPVRIKEPKPRILPALVPPSALPKPKVSPPSPPPPSPKPQPVAANGLELTFYGNVVSFPLDPLWKSYRLPGGAKPEVMSAFWGLMSGSQYEATVAAINASKKALQLDDWGHVSLWREVVQALQPGRLAEQNLLLWYFLVKSGYDVRLGYAGADIHLFVAVRQQVFSTKFTSVGKENYYAVLSLDRGDSIGSFYTYEASYPIKLKPLDIGVAATGFTKTVEAKRDLSFEYHGKKVLFSVPYDRRLVQFMGTYPQSGFDLYFSTDGSSSVRRVLLSELKKYTEPMSEEEAVNFLLSFVQKAFAYKTDEEQFGYEKYFFVEESLHFPYNDCEDRSVLFSWLVRQLLGLKTIGLLYPGHMTTAVALKQSRPGFSTVEHQGTRFVIADPTYIGASVGMAMPSYAQLKPERVIDLH